MDAGLPLDRLEHHRRGALADRGAQRLRVVARDRPESRQVGAKLSLVARPGVAESEPIVRPWKAPSRTTISGSAMPRPCACLRTSLIAHSFASVPELQRNALPPGSSSAEPLGEPHAALGQVEVRGVRQGADLLAHRLDHCRVAVADGADRDPRQEVEVLLPSESQSRAPSPRTNSTGVRA